MSHDKKNIIIYNTADGKASVSLYAKDGMVWGEAEGSGIENRN